VVGEDGGLVGVFLAQVVKGLTGFFLGEAGARPFDAAAGTSVVADAELGDPAAALLVFVDGSVPCRTVVFWVGCHFLSLLYGHTANMLVSGKVCL
jgi:hypothetical protein